MRDDGPGPTIIMMLQEEHHLHLGHLAGLLLKATYSNSHIHWWRWLSCNVLTSASGAVWGSVSFPRTLQHADQGN